MSADAWPELNWPDWHDTAETMHRWTQIVGKVRMKFAPMANHWWQVALYVDVLRPDDIAYSLWADDVPSCIRTSSIMLW